MDALKAEHALALDLLQHTHLSLWEMLQRSVAQHAERPAVAMGDSTWTYEELFERSLRAAACLAALGVGHGTRVAFLLPTCPEWAVLHYALACLGAVAVPVNFVFEARELRHVLATAAPEVVVTAEGFRGVSFAAKLQAVDPELVDGATAVASLPSVRHVVVLPMTPAERPDATDGRTATVFGTDATTPLAPRGGPASSDPAYIVFTSGSTAAPKPALCAHRSFLGAATGFVHGLRMGPDDRFLAMLPTFHTGGVTCDLTAPHLSGGCTQLLGAFDPAEALAAIEAHRCTVTVGFDTMYTKMTAAPEFATADVSSLRKSILAATPSYIDRLRRIWDFDLFATSYGSTESGTLAAITPAWLEDLPTRQEANGRPLPGVDMIIVDPETGARCGPGVGGEICFRGWCRVIEYVGLPDETAASIDDEGYFHSGDYGWLDEDGNLYFRGRYKMMIKTGGENVAEREVEIFLEQELDVVEFAQVVGVPDETWGEAVVAFVQLSEDTDSETLRAMAVGRIARYKIPKRFIALRADEFPTLANGRPDKGALRRLAQERTSA